MISGFWPKLKGLQIVTIVCKLKKNLKIIKVLTKKMMNQMKKK